MERTLVECQQCGSEDILTCERCGIKGCAECGDVEIRVYNCSVPYDGMALCDDCTPPCRCTECDPDHYNDMRYDR